MAVVRTVTAVVAILTVPLCWPAGTVSDPESAAALSLLTVTAAPPSGAGPDNVTVAVDDWPPVTLAGFKVKPVTVGSGGVIVSGALAEVLLYAAVIFAVVFDVTEDVSTVKVPVVWPAATVADVGVAALLSLETFTAAPPAGAGPESVTVPVDEPPPVTLVGLRATPTTFGLVGSSERIRY